MSHLLVVGGTSGIGAEVFRQAFTSGEEEFDQVTAVGPKDMDVRSARSINRCLGTIPPVTHTAYSAGIASLQMIPDLCRDSIQSEGMAEDEMLDVFNINVIGFMRLLSVLTHKADKGRVVAIVSDASRTPMRGSMAYCSSKAALAMAVKCAARELAPNWSINGISPSAVEDTPMSDWIDETVPNFRGWTKEQARSYEIAGIPKGRRAFKEEVAELVLTTLTGPEFLTGSIIELTGGK